MKKDLAQKTSFDYSDFDADIRGKLICIAAAINNHRVSACGELMSAAKEIAKAHGVLAAAGHEGRFSQYVEAECHFSRATAYRLIEINSVFGGFEHVSHIEDSALRKLASTSTPEDVVKAAKRAASGGTFIKLDWVKERLDKWTAENVEDDDEDEPDTIEVESVDADDEEDAVDSDDDTEFEEEDFDSEVDDEGSSEPWSGGGDVDKTHVAPIDFKKIGWEAAVRKIANLIDEIGIAANVGGDRMQKAHDYMRKLDERIRVWGGKR